MASITQEDLVSLLKKLNISLNDFPDLSFDALCEEESLQDFLSWLCKSFDGDNILTDEEIADYQSIQNVPLNNGRITERVGDDHSDISDDILTSLEMRLEQDLAKLSKLKVLDDQLHRKEKEALTNYSQKKKALTTLVANDMSDEVEAEIEKTLQTCLSIQPYVPDIESYNLSAEELYSSLNKFFEESVENVKKGIQYAEESLKPQIEDLEESLVKLQFEEELSISRLSATKTLLDNNSPTGSNFELCQTYSGDDQEIKNKARLLVQKKMRTEEVNGFRRTLCSNEYLIKALELNRELLIDSLITVLLEHSFISDRLSKTEKLSGLIFTFINEVSNESDLLEKLMKRSDSETKVVKGDTEVDELDGCPLSSTSCKKLAMVTCANLLEALKKEYALNLETRECVGSLLSYLRTGPTLRFDLVPMDLRQVLHVFNILQDNLQGDLRKIAGSFSELKTEIKRNPSRQEQLLWMNFLTDPSKAISLRHEYSSFFTFRTDQ